MREGWHPAEHADAAMTLTDKDRRRFATRYDIASNGCWLWRSGFLRDGYGSFGAGGKTLLAHHVAWEMAHGPRPGGVFVLHTCDTPACVNPAHLFLGTHLDNMRDCKAKGRRPHGESQYNAKLTDEAVIDIRQRYGAGAYAVELAKQYGVGVAVVKRAARGGAWAHLDSIAPPLAPRTRRAPRGERANKSRLTADKVVEIRQRVAAGETTRKLAAAFGISGRSVSAIARRETWTHIPPETEASP